MSNKYKYDDTIKSEDRTIQYFSKMNSVQKKPNWFKRDISDVGESIKFSWRTNTAYHLNPLETAMYNIIFSNQHMQEMNIGRDANLKELAFKCNDWFYENEYNIYSDLIS